MVEEWVENCCIKMICSEIFGMVLLPSQGVQICSEIVGPYFWNAGLQSECRCPGEVLFFCLCVFLWCVFCLFVMFWVEQNLIDDGA